ncbi:hypothetical protein T265_01825 [Opisthorchis viverrini]|uniref:Uncharacterized protein n=1 Tax=Opisthorchis viverrini TaxID=6198 RepID=A0A075A1B5_OPIVI|nr:hypothetical protein T265_01825 [Opisthorchis viverrini]KER32047.1 hypothetical protein T265_01825 [Opisthorchis viverrini]
MPPIPSSSKRLLDPNSPSSVSPLLPKKRLAGKRHSTKPHHPQRRVDRLSQLNSACSVVLTDISLPAVPGSCLSSSSPNESQLHTDLASLSARVHKMENELLSYRIMQPIACLLTPDAICDPSDLAKASVFIDMLASEITRRMESPYLLPTITGPQRPAKSIGGTRGKASLVDNASKYQFKIGSPKVGAGDVLSNFEDYREQSMLSSAADGNARLNRWRTGEQKRVPVAKLLGYQ